MSLEGKALDHGMKKADGASSSAVHVANGSKESVHVVISDVDNPNAETSEELRSGGVAEHRASGYTKHTQVKVKVTFRDGKKATKTTDNDRSIIITASQELVEANKYSDMWEFWDKSSIWKDSDNVCHNPNCRDANCDC